MALYYGRTVNDMAQEISNVCQKTRINKSKTKLGI